MANSPVFHLGSKMGHKKKDGSWFGNSTLLHKDSYGNWTVSVIWWVDEDSFNSSAPLDIPVGYPVRIIREGLDNNISGMVENDDVAPLDFPA